ncbi:TRAP transporter permease [Natronobacterium texcoconense]|uniref:TRAP transporter, 4TM/12TM fusion protein n=1 Tax=Natronobacterium texcoconense TaxID=1095778 RepID=A0A1H1ICY6_NATTX|nr:TRAP transporter fused permease subunit [Natronobacterium texcoconense]SDR35552.1 TRAP transporter, 4TM/12TM fusion protein [Natronobacterium texcoconense]
MDDGPPIDEDDTEAIDISSEESTVKDVDEDLAERSIGAAVRERVGAESLKRKTTLWTLLGVLSIPFWLYVMWMAYLQAELTGQAPSRAQFGAGFLGGIIALYALHEMAQRVGGGQRFIWTDVKALFSRENIGDTLTLIVAVLLMIPTVVYVYVNALDLAGRGGATQPELVMAALFTLVMIYVTWRAFGITFLAVLLAGIGYGLFGYLIPGTLGHTGIGYQRMLRVLVISMDGFFGFLTQLTAAWIALFLLYAGMLKAYGAFDLILRAAVQSAKYLDSGVAQTAVIASAVIGSVNGSQTANAGMTGSFTIPMMKQSGVKPETAGGIESVASTSGQVLPPVMGAGAFVMATLIPGMSYFDVIIAGLIPAAILMITIVVAVHYAAAPQIEEPDMDEMFDQRLTRFELGLEAVKFGIPLALLVYLLGIVQFTVMTSAFWTVVTMATLGIVIPTGKQAFDTTSLRLTFWTFVGTLKQTFDGFREGIVVLAPVAIILAAINGVVDILMATGVPTAISLTLMDLSGGVLIVAAIMAMIICILLGLGMPTTAAYTIVALLIAPTLVEQFFLPEFAGHFFVFYAAILAGLTPPIATCVAVATGIAGSNFWRTCFEAIKISAPLFVLPFSFIYHTDIVNHQGEFGSGLLFISALVLLGGLVIIHGLNYRFDLGTWPTYGLRGLFVVLGIVVMVHPELLVQLGALGVAAFLYLTQAAVGEASPLEKLQNVTAGIGGRRE